MLIIISTTVQYSKTQEKNYILNISKNSISKLFFYICFWLLGKMNESCMNNNYWAYRTVSDLIFIFILCISDTYMQKAKRSFSDSRNSRNRNLNKLSDELQGVQRIMIQNIDDVLQRGENLSGITKYYAIQKLPIY